MRCGTTFHFYVAVAALGQVWMLQGTERQSAAARAAETERVAFKNGIRGRDSMAINGKSTTGVAESARH